MKDVKTKQNDQAVFTKLKSLFTENPNALADHPELFEIITLNETRVDNVMSLAQRQVTQLKARIEDHNKAMIRFVDNAKHHEFITDKLFEITYELTACVELSDIFDVLYQDSLHAFSVEATGIKLNLDIPSLKELSELDSQLQDNPAYRKIFDQVKIGSSISGSHFDIDSLSLFFGPHTENTASAAFTPLIMPNSSNCIGIMGLSSSNPDKFRHQSSYGTLHLDRLGKITTIAIDRVLHKK